MSDVEEKVLHELFNIPLSKSPFLMIAQNIGISEDEVLEIAQNLAERDVIRRFGASLAHRDIGFSENGMVTFCIPEEEVEQIGRKIASQKFVTHCYERVGLPFNLFTMVHGRSRKEVEDKAAILERLAGRKCHKIFFSEKQYKKTSLRY